MISIETGFALPRLFISRYIELGKESEEDDHQRGSDDWKLPGITTSGSQAENHHHGLQKDQGELEHLEWGQVLLPPQIRLHPRSQSGQKIVGIHDDVHDGIDETSEGFLAAWNKKWIDN